MRRRLIIGVLFTGLLLLALLGFILRLPRTAAAALIHKETATRRAPPSNSERRKKMHETLMTPLPASWLASRLSIDRKEIEELRRRGELIAVRQDESDEWLYPAWQFGPGGKVPQGVRDAVSAALSVGLTEARLVALLHRRVGLMGGGRFLDLLFEGRADTVVDAIRSASVHA